MKKVALVGTGILIGLSEAVAVIFHYLTNAFIM